MSARLPLLAAGPSTSPANVLTLGTTKSDSRLSTRQRHTDSEWQQLEPVIRQLLAVETRMIKDVLLILEKEHNFKTGLRSLKSRMKRWGLRRNLCGNDMRILVMKEDQRKSQGKDTAFTFCGSVLKPEKLTTFRKRPRDPSEYWPSPSASTPENVQYSTPETQSQCQSTKVDGDLRSSPPQSACPSPNLYEQDYQRQALSHSSETSLRMRGQKSAFELSNHERFQGTERPSTSDPCAGKRRCQPLTFEPNTPLLKLAPDRLIRFAEFVSLRNPSAKPRGLVKDARMAKFRTQSRIGTLMIHRLPPTGDLLMRIEYFLEEEDIMRVSSFLEGQHSPLVVLKKKRPHEVASEKPLLQAFETEVTEHFLTILAYMQLLNICPAWTPIMKMVRPASSSVFETVRRGDLAGLKIMLADGRASVNDHDEFGASLLLPLVCKFLIQAGLDLNHFASAQGVLGYSCGQYRNSMHTDIRNQTCLQSSQNRIDECCRLLLDAGADLVVEGHSDKTVLSYLLWYEIVAIGSKHTLRGLWVSTMDYDGFEDACEHVQPRLIMPRRLTLGYQTNGQDKQHQAISPSQSGSISQVLFSSEASPTLSQNESLRVLIGADMAVTPLDYCSYVASKLLQRRTMSTVELATPPGILLRSALARCGLDVNTIRDSDDRDSEAYYSFHFDRANLGLLLADFKHLSRGELW